MPSKSKPKAAKPLKNTPAPPAHVIPGIHPEVRAALADLAALVRELRPTLPAGAADEARAFCARAAAINATKPGK